MEKQIETSASMRARMRPLVMSRGEASHLVNDLINATVNAYQETGIKYAKKRQALAQKIINAIAGEE